SARAASLHSLVLPVEHRHADSPVASDGGGFGVAGVGVADDAGAGIVAQHQGQPEGGVVGAVGHNLGAGVDGAAHADAAAVVDGDPGGAAGDVQQGVQDGPVGDGVGAVGHRLGLPVGGGD